MDRQNVNNWNFCSQFIGFAVPLFTSQSLKNVYNRAKRFFARKNLIFNICTCSFRQPFCNIDRCGIFCRNRLSFQKNPRVQVCCQARFHGKGWNMMARKDQEGYPKNCPLHRRILPVAEKNAFLWQASFRQNTARSFLYPRGVSSLKK